MEEKISAATVNNNRALNKALAESDRIIALFYLSWCPFCARFLPVFQKQVEQSGRHFVLVKDDQEAMGGDYSVKIYPTVLFFEKGTVAQRLDGAPRVGLDEQQLTEFLDQCPS
jgi:thioredoxin-like negative regulator of GroEL